MCPSGVVKLHYFVSKFYIFLCFITEPCIGLFSIFSPSDSFKGHILSSSFFLFFFFFLSFFLFGFIQRVYSSFLPCFILSFHSVIYYQLNRMTRRGQTGTEIRSVQVVLHSGNRTQKAPNPADLNEWGPTSCTLSPLLTKSSSRSNLVFYA